MEYTGYVIEYTVYVIAVSHQVVSSTYVISIYHSICHRNMSWHTVVYVI